MTSTARTTSIELLAQKQLSRQFSLSVEAEFTTGLTMVVGPNGSGKTTLMQILATALPPDQGHYRLNNRSVLTPAGRREARRNLGWLPQTFGYDPHVTARSYLHYVGWLRGLPRTRLRAEAVRRLEAVGLADAVDTRLSKLSGGMLRRLGLAAATLDEPAVLLLDEPTAGLDIVQRQQLYDVLRGLESTTLVIMSTHLVEDIRALGHQVLFLSRGVAHGTESMAGVIAAAGGSSRVDDYIGHRFRGGPAGG